MYFKTFLRLYYYVPKHYGIFNSNKYLYFLYVINCLLFYFIFLAESLIYKIV